MLNCPSLTISAFTTGPILLYLYKVVRAEVAQMVERGPEKAGVGGSIPSLGIWSRWLLSAHEH